MDGNRNEDMQYCLGCLSHSSTMSLYCYKPHNESLKTLMQGHCLYLCYICNRIMHKTEQFIECVNNNQLVMQNVENVKLNLSSKTQKTQYQFSAVEKVILENTEPKNVNDIGDSIYEVYGRSVDHKIIMKLKEESIDEVLHDLDIPESLKTHRNFFDNSIKVEDVNIDDKCLDESVEILTKSSFENETTITENNENVITNEYFLNADMLGKNSFANETTTERSDTDSKYGSIAPGPSTIIVHKKCNVHKMCVTMYSRQDFKPSAIQSTDNGARRLKKAPKTSAERARQFRARKALLKQQSKQQQESYAINEIAIEDIRSTDPSEGEIPGPSEKRTIEEREMSAEATLRWREKKKDVSESSKKQAKTAAQRMREYRERKKLAKKILLKEQRDQDLDAIVRTSSQVNRKKELK